MSVRDAAHVRVPPPLVFAASIGLGFALNAAASMTFLPSSAARLAVGVVLVLTGVSTVVWSAVLLKRSGQNPEPWQPTPSIIKAGPYARSRNPVYVGMTIVQCGVATISGVVWIYLTACLSVAAVWHFVVAREEAYLQRKFGDEYREYCAQVRRWV